MDVRGDLQALDLEDLSALLTRGDAFFEDIPGVGRFGVLADPTGAVLAVMKPKPGETQG